MSVISMLCNYFPDKVAKAVKSLDREVLNRITELRIRRNKELVIVIKNTSYFIDFNGNLTYEPDNYSVVVNDEDLNSVFMEMCSYSIYSCTEQLKEGFITLECGARIGIGASAVYRNGEISSVKDVTSINIRIPNDIEGCAEKVLNFLYINSFPSIIVAGRPNSGKTTLLRDMARQLSSGFNSKYRKITLIDERFEFSGNIGNESLKTGINTDVLSGFSKEKGIEIATRCLSPEMIICDEVSTIREVNSIRYAFSSGISFALSVHASCREELRTKPIINELISTACFSYIVLLDEYTYLPEIIDVNEVLYENSVDNNAAFFNNGSGFSVI